jgi:hypothetical protein
MVGAVGREGRPSACAIGPSLHPNPLHPATSAVRTCDHLAVRARPDPPRPPPSSSSPPSEVKLLLRERVDERQPALLSGRHLLRRQQAAIEHRRRRRVVKLTPNADQLRVHRQTDT